VPAPAPLRPGLVPVPLRPGPVPPVPAAWTSASERKVTKEIGAEVTKEIGAETTLMLRNLGAKVTKEILLEELRLCGMEGRVDFVQAWVDFQTKSCTGDAYLNFFDPADAHYLQEMWHGREELGGIPCSRGRRRSTLSVAFARKQGFDRCVLEGRRRHFKDVNVMGWIHPSKEGRCRAFEVQPGLSWFWSPPGLAVEVQPGLAVEVQPGLAVEVQPGPPGFWPPPGLAVAAASEADAAGAA